MNYLKNGGKKMKYGVSEVETEGTADPLSKPSRYPAGVDVSDPNKWFEKEAATRVEAVLLSYAV